jgi:hypothetical protein
MTHVDWHHDDTERYGHHLANKICEQASSQHRDLGLPVNKISAAGAAGRFANIELAPSLVSIRRKLALGRARDSSSDRKIQLSFRPVVSGLTIQIDHNVSTIRKPRPQTRRIGRLLDALGGISRISEKPSGRLRRPRE